MLQLEFSQSLSLEMQTQFLMKIKLRTKTFHKNSQLNFINLGFMRKDLRMINETMLIDLIYLQYKGRRPKKTGYFMTLCKIHLTPTHPT